MFINKKLKNLLIFFSEFYIITLCNYKGKLYPFAKICPRGRTPKLKEIMCFTEQISRRSGENGKAFFTFDNHKKAARGERLCGKISVTTFG